MLPSSADLTLFPCHSCCTPSDLEIPFFHIMRSSLLFTDNSRSPPQSPYPDVVPLRLFQILRFFPYPLAHKATCLLPNKMSITDWFFFLCWTLFFPLIFYFPSPLAVLQQHWERCWKVLLVGSLCFWWTSMLTPLSRSTDTMSYVLCILSLSLALSFLSALLYPHPSST